MKRTLVVASAFSLAFGLLFSGCSKKSNNTFSRANDDTRETYETVKNDMQEGKGEFVDKVEKKLDSLNREISELRKKIEEHSGNTKRKLRKQWEMLDRRREKLEKDLGELKARTSENWKDLKQDIDDQLDSLNERFENLKKELGIGHNLI